MGKWIPIDQAFAEIDKRQEGIATTKNEALTNRVRGLERSREMEETCRIEGCDEERVPHRAICNKHYKERQRESREKRKPGKDLPPTTPKAALEKKEPTRYQFGARDLCNLIAPLRRFSTDEEALAYFEGFLRGREVV